MCNVLYHVGNRSSFDFIVLMSIKHPLDICSVPK